MSRAPFLPISATNPPLTPTAQQARQQLLNELSKPQYQAARPTLFDILSKDLLNWFESLFQGANPGNPGDFGSLFGTLGDILLILLVVALLVVGFVLFGLPRLNRRSKGLGSLFGDEDDRDSVTLRKAAERAAASGDYSTAMAEEFRSIARNLSERAVLTTFPGTTAHGFALEASTYFPLVEPELRAVADSFDGVRYLGTTGTESEWLAASSLESRLRAAKPVFHDADLDEVTA